MIDPGTLAVFCAASLALLIVPGPAVTYIVAQSINGGRSAGLASVAGVHLGTLVHILAAALGLSALIASSAEAYDLVRYAGAAYLIYLGVRALFGSGELPDAQLDLSPSRWELIRQGAIVNVLNPKTAIFFLAFLPQFVEPGSGSTTAQIMVLGMLFGLLGVLSDGAYALAAAAARDHLLRSARLARWRERVTGGIFIALGVSAALTGRRH